MKEQSAQVHESKTTFYHPRFKAKACKNLDLLRVVREQTYLRLDLIYYKSQKQASNIITLQIAPNTFVTPDQSRIKLNLLRAENIAIAPKVSKMKEGVTATTFSLYFEPLPKNYSQFTLIEKLSKKGNYFNLLSINLADTRAFPPAKLN